jgi:organic hydroperoxide reductase OsmC/OhrA
MGGYAVAKTAKEFRYTIAQDRAGRVSADGKSELELDPNWAPEHLVLAGLVRCTLASLRFHADRAGVDFVARASGSARVTRRKQDDRYAFIEIAVELELELEPEPAPTELADLVAKAERDCFVGASLTVAPDYRWQVNGRPLSDV